MRKKKQNSYFAALSLNSSDRGVEMFLTDNEKQSKIPKIDIVSFFLIDDDNKRTEIYH